MRVIAPKNVNKVYDLASKLSDSMLPFFFIKKNQESLLPMQSNFTLKINRQMTPFLKNLPQQARLGFWSLPQIQTHEISPITFKDSIILNPFKTEKFIMTSLNKGIKKMVVSDIEQINKIQNCYFRLIKQGRKIEEPEYIWAIEEKNQDLQDLLNLQRCNIPIHGYNFNRQMKYKQISSLLRYKEIIDPSLPKFRQIELQSLEQEKNMLQKQKIQPLITNYSQVDDYIMVCRIIGKEKTGKPIFQNKCLDFICKGEVCTCSNAPKILDTFKTKSQQWAIVNPIRLDKLDQDYIIHSE